MYSSLHVKFFGTVYMVRKVFPVSLFFLGEISEKRDVTNS